MIKRKDITTRFDGTQRKFDLDDWFSLSACSSTSGGEFDAVYSGEMTLFRVELNLVASTYLNQQDKDGWSRVEERLVSKLMHHLYREIINDIHDVRMNVEFEGREKSLKAIDRLMSKISKEMTG